ncbi:hypothetical protein CASFOL_007969 [Castilleja foliolosa]|uniref:Uncharacterized protein n=1 Tax=Castilleja foliolosa TaxID=1961234 RepID=A0ABD3E214_9LAMI
MRSSMEFCLDSLQANQPIFCICTYLLYLYRGYAVVGTKTHWVVNSNVADIYLHRPINSSQANRCFTTNHKFRIGRSMNNGNYDQRFLYQPPSTSEIPTETFFKYKSSVSSQELVN